MPQEYPTEVNRWDVFEAVLQGPAEGNPFKDQKLTGIFVSSSESVQVEGFYDGEGIYKIRFMPSFEGRYQFILRATFIDESLNGSFFVKPAALENHGPVRTANTFHFAYEDGTSFYPVGTTAYVWDLQDDGTIAETLDTLSHAYFNKIRFCIFPKHYAYNLKEPRSYPYEGTPMDSSVLTEDNYMEYTGKTEGNHFDFSRFNPSHFRHIEYCIKELGKRGIEADIILFHPYDRWGFSSMTAEQDAFYLKYVMRRFSAYHNVWWAIANEWDLFNTKSVEDWERIASVIVKSDPYHHLRSIHNCREMYDHSKPWITHCSVQRVDLYKGAEDTDSLRIRYQKPVVMDEIGYEGNLPYGWGCLTAQEMVRRFWETAIRGGYPGHGETYLTKNAGIWWAHGGNLNGDSWKRAGFLLDVLRDVPGNGLTFIPMEWDGVTAVPETEWYMPVKSQYIFYYSFMRPSYRDYYIDDDTDYVAEVLDTWNMTLERSGIFHGHFRVQLPGCQYIAVRLRKASVSDYDSSLKEEAEQTAEPEIQDEYLEADVNEEPAVSETAEESEVIAEPAEDTPFDADRAAVEKENTADDEMLSQDDSSEEADTEGNLDDEEIPDIVNIPQTDFGKHARKEDTLSIPPVDFTRSINEEPKK